MVSRGRFLALAHAQGLRVRKPESKILILDDEEYEGREFCRPLCSLNVLRCIVVLEAPWIIWDDANTRKRAVGEAAIVRKWCEAFCEGSQ